MDKAEYRMISLERLIDIRVGEKLYKVIGAPKIPKVKAAR